MPGTSKFSAAAATATGNQTLSTGLGELASAVILWGVNLTASGYGAQVRFFLGLATSTTQRGCVSMASDDAAASSDSTRRVDTDRCIHILGSGDPTTDGVADFVEFQSDGDLVINWSDAPSSAWLIHGLAFAASVHSSAKAGSYTTPTSTGTLDVTDPGFDAEFALVAGIGAPGAGTGAFASGAISLGCGASASQRFACAIRDRDAQATMDTIQLQVSDAIYHGLGAAAASSLMVADYNGSITNGFQLDFTTVAASAQTHLYLALAGGEYAVGVETQRTSTGTKTTSGLGITPDGLFMASCNAAASSSINTGLCKLSVGASANGTEGHTWIECADATADSDTNSRTEATKGIGMATRASTTNAEADASFASGQFTLDWTTADATAREFGYATFGTPAAPAGSRQTLTLMGVGS